MTVEVKDPSNQAPTPALDPTAESPLPATGPSTPPNVDDARKEVKLDSVNQEFRQKFYGTKDEKTGLYSGGIWGNMFVKGLRADDDRNKIINELCAAASSTKNFSEEKIADLNTKMEKLIALSSECDNKLAELEKDPEKFLLSEADFVKAHPELATKDKSTQHLEYILSLNSIGKKEVAIFIQEKNKVDSGAEGKEKLSDPTSEEIGLKELKDDEDGDATVIKDGISYSSKTGEYTLIDWGTKVKPTTNPGDSAKGGLEIVEPGSLKLSKGQKIQWIETQDGQRRPIDSPQALLAMLQELQGQRISFCTARGRLAKFGNAIADTGGYAAGGAAIGAGLGLFGGPLAPLTSTAGAIGGGVIGGIAGIGRSIWKSFKG
ncbi:MAG: hypothetical protein GYA55_14430, partial [SAR324 cluster bacterium]|nr:hypothetical protein [SAR324 cluster bacterium]